MISSEIDEDRDFESRFRAQRAPAVVGTPEAIALRFFPAALVYNITLLRVDIRGHRSGLSTSAAVYGVAVGNSGTEDFPSPTGWRAFRKAYRNTRNAAHRRDIDAGWKKDRVMHFKSRHIVVVPGIVNETAFSVTFPSISMETPTIIAFIGN